jgi:chemotaxis protein MotB
MRRWMMAAVLITFVIALTGCTGALKKENAALMARIDTLNTANQTLTQEKQSCQDGLRAVQNELEKQMAELKAKEMEVQEKSHAYQQMQNAMKAEVDAKTVTIQELEGRLTVSLVEAILFDSGKAVVKKDGKAALKKVAEVLKDIKDQEILVAGHTDNVPITSKLAATYPTNWELSAARAIAVVKLLESDGVDPKMLVAAGFGEFRPVADNETPEGRAQNRRMEIILMPKRM